MTNVVLTMVNKLTYARPILAIRASSTNRTIFISSTLINPKIKRTINLITFPPSILFI